MKPFDDRSLPDPARRAWLRKSAWAAGAVALGGTGLGFGPLARADGPLTPLKLSWNAGSICTAPVVVGVKQGFFRRHGLDVELVNFAGSTDQLLEAIATGKSDAGVGMALRWVKPLEQGFDVKLTAGIHGGCMRLLATRTSGIVDLPGLKGRTVGVSDMASPAKNFFAITLKKIGVDPENDVHWRQYPANLLGEALKKGEVHAIADGDPTIWTLRESDHLYEVSNNLCGEYQNRVCCVLGVRGSLVRKDRATAQGLTQALLEATEWTADHPAEAATLFSAYAPQADVAQLTAMLKSHTDRHHPVGDAFKKEIALYADDLKTVGVVNSGTNSDRFASRVFADVLT
ncbi:ABC transporter substrate-binding protein [Paraburkholderia caballeronis]|uniref:NitT/TauT family transport system substrate-binding protein n=1 Tax=Paraburkholderia caballeronis TaxID=416943 RepID=A0A1H7P570_9BURK|nr:ABC transporter substrate-binding protein [Paraburkholderia caballeronis]PXW25396.1 NitT/TauT family transport system substrate-binding protein [Paraburkholderia caballeronis]PXX01003.1 NitT/TauT family transport system substrate-binding protein [Paraburkholderia caballeronis]RAJ99644.1 NitT/TauT family transport system substrate-binding protein [Paraburkholderia caballeronis]SEE39140.1 NitT/TauT family transport system substrate-binding protein [Paraburkholderia caballeronis]SEL30415.1 Nit